ncbi:MAG: RNA polymerase sigma factor [Dehalococcoidia bacterium]
MEQAKAGDPEVWRQWFDDYYPSLFRYAYIRIKRRPEAEDVVSQVFLEAVRGIGRYRYTGKPLLAWLYRIERNLISDRMKAEERRPDRPEEAPVTPRPATDNSIRLVQNLDLRQALEKLTDEQREVIILRYFLSLSTQEVADLMGKRTKAVFSLQARALASLRRWLGDDFLQPDVTDVAGGGS